MTQINKIYARQIIDSRGTPTIEVDCQLSDGSMGRAAVPSGASTGQYEALELRDNNSSYFGKSVLTAINNVNTIIKPALIGNTSNNIYEIDQIMRELDNTENKTNLGANATLAVSLANAKCSALLNKKSLFKNLGKSYSLPIPLMNIINGGAHADNDLNIQEFMIRPDSAKNITEAIEKCFLVIQNLKKLLQSKKMLTNVGDEGGFAPSINTNEEALELIVQAIEKSNLKAGNDIVICLDVAANELVNKNGEYSIQSKNFTSPDNVINYYQKLTSEYPIKSIEDPFAEDDWDSWKKITDAIGGSVQIVGDDLFVTNTKRLEKGINEKSANSILIKPNQIGTLTETLEVISMAKKANFNTIISHRSGDTEDTFIADLAVGTNSNQIKTGSLARSERIAKYNQLIRIEEDLGRSAKMNKID